jgi:hypothetical protein
MLKRMSPKKRAVDDAAPDQAMRDQEVLRANRELAAYFKGRRTEREARAALKIIKAFVRDRERQGPKSRPPLPGRAATAGNPGGAPKATRQRKRRAKPRQKISPATAAVENDSPLPGVEPVD